MLDRGQHIGQRPSTRRVKISAIGCDERHTGLLGELDPLCQLSLVIGSAMKFPQEVTAVTERFAIAVKLRGLCVADDAGQKSLRMGGQIVEP